MKTRSVDVSQVCGFSSSRYGGAHGKPFSGALTRIGPATPRCNQIAAAPGPPLKTKVIGRASRAADAGVSLDSPVVGAVVAPAACCSYATKNIRALVFPESSFSGIVPAVVVYASD